MFILQKSSRFNSESDPIGNCSSIFTPHKTIHKSNVAASLTVVHSKYSYTLKDAKRSLVYSISLSNHFCLIYMFALELEYPSSQQGPTQTYYRQQFENCLEAYWLHCNSMFFHKTTKLACMIQT